MLDYFNEDFAKAKGRVIDSSFISIHRTVIKNHPRIRERFVSSAHSVPPTHLLYRILNGLGLSPDMLSTSIDYHVKERARKMASALNITSPNSYGSTFSNQFLNGGSESVIFTYEPYQKSRWDELEPVQYVYHTNTNTNFQRGTPDDDGDYAFIKINVPMLAYQYLMWLRWKRELDVQENIYNFIAKYPLFNSLKSYMDISLFNRHYFRVIGKEIHDDPKVLEYPVPEIDDRLSKSNVNIVNELLGKGTTVGSALFNTPSFFNDSALDLTKPIPTITTQQIQWFLIACKLPYLHYGLQLASDSGQVLDQSNLSNLSRELRAFINSRTLSHVPKHMKLHIIDNYLEDLLLLCNSLR